MKAMRALLCVAVVLVLAAPASAQFDDQEQLGFVSARPYGAVTAFGVYVGPYRAQVLPGGIYFDIFCVDFAHQSLSRWTANFTPLVSGGDLGNTRAGDFSAYQRAAYLSSQFGKTDQGEWGGLHATIWNIFTPNDPAVTAGTALHDQVLRWNREADANAASFNTDYWYVVSDAEGVGQEYMTYVTPEPETIFLLGTGLAAVFGMSIVMRRSLG